MKVRILASPCAAAAFGKGKEKEKYFRKFWYSFHIIVLLKIES